jgi:hypothetical protein
MKYSILMLLFLIVSCGKNQSASSSAAVEEQERGHTGVNASDTAVPDLLNVTLDVPIELSTDRITFLKSASMTDQGKRHSCSMSVSDSEIWHYSLSGNQLNIEMVSGTQLNMVKHNSYGTGAHGVWIAKALSHGMKMIYRFTLFNDRIILNQDCEG